MPTWAISISTIITVIIILGGALNFPYIPMLFGVYGADRHTGRGRLVYILIWLFPFAALACLIVAWTSNTLFALAPFAYIVITWLMRPNKGINSGPSKHYSSESQNLQACLSDIDDNWPEWSSYSPDKCFMLFSFFSPSKEASIALKQSLTKNVKLCDDFEESVYDNHSQTTHASIYLEKLSKEAISEITRRVVNTAWSNNSELQSLYVMKNE